MVKLLKYYPYSTAHTSGDFMQLDADIVRPIQRALVAQSGQPWADNKECYLFVDDNHDTVAVEFHDGIAYFGKSINLTEEGKHDAKIVAMHNSRP